MAFIDDFADLMTATVTVEPFVSRTAYGVATYGAAADFAARVNYETHLVRAADGEERVARGTIWLARSTAVGVQDRVTLPDGSAPIILSSVLETDEVGPQFCKIEFG